MYSNELSQLINNNYVSLSDYKHYFNVLDSPQIIYIEYIHGTNKHKVITNDGYEWNFIVKGE